MLNFNEAQFTPSYNYLKIFSFILCSVILDLVDATEKKHIIVTILQQLYLSFFFILLIPIDESNDLAKMLSIANV